MVMPWGSYIIMHRHLFRSYGTWPTIDRPYRVTFAVVYSNGSMLYVAITAWARCSRRLARNPDKFDRVQNSLG